MIKRTGGPDRNLSNEENHDPVTVECPVSSPFPAWMSDDLAKSAISEQAARQRGIVPIDAVTARNILGFPSYTASKQPCQGYVIPFNNPDIGIDMTCPDGRPFRRIKLHEPSVGHDGKLAKYLSPKEAGQHAYILPEVHQALQKEGAMVILTEGEKKAICATERGLPVIGLVGIWGWRDPANGKGVPNDKLLLELISYTNVKEWLMIFDSDASDAAKVYEFQKVAIRLSKVLFRDAVTLKQIILPSLGSSGKTGLDDFAVHYGAAFNNELKKLMDTATVVSPDLRAITSKTNGQSGGRPPQVFEIANACADALRDADDRLLLQHHHSTWYRYQQCNYRAISYSELEGLIMTQLRRLYPAYATPSMQRSVIANLESHDLCGILEATVMPCFLDSGKSADRLLIMKNSVIQIDLLVDSLLQKVVDHRQIFKSHSPLLFSDKYLDYPYDALAQCLQWDHYVISALPDPDDQKMLQMMFGLALLPDTSRNVFFLLYGPAGTGKSVAVEVLRALVGAENCCSVSLDNLYERFALYPLTDKLLNLVGDQSSNLSLSIMPKVEGLLKDITGGGTIQVEQKNKEAVSRKATARCIIATNHFPSFTDTSNGIWDRLRVIPFNQRFRDNRAEIPCLADQVIASELPGVLNWALHGLVLLKAVKGFPVSSTSSAIKNQQRTRSDSTRAFLIEMTDVVTAGQVGTQDLYLRYCDYCAGELVPPTNQSVFARRVQEYDTRVSKKRVRDDNGVQTTVWIGLSLKQ